MAKIGKRKYPAVYDRNGKWFTGWEGDVHTGPVPEHVVGNPYWEDKFGFIKSDDHVAAKLELQYVRYSRGRSAANIIMQDIYGNTYAMSLSGFDILMKLTHWPRLKLRKEGYVGSLDSQDKYDISSCRNGDGEWFEGTFCQTKQGQNYFIEPCEVN